MQNFKPRERKDEIFFCCFFLLLMASPHHRYRSSSSQFSDEMNRIFAAPAYTHLLDQSSLQNPLHHPVHPRLENGETLESAFSRLSVNSLNKYSGLDNASVFYDYREVGCSPFALQETEQIHHQGSPGCCSSNDFVPGFDSTSNTFSRTR